MCFFIVKKRNYGLIRLMEVYAKGFKICLILYSHVNIEQGIHWGKY